MRNFLLHIILIISTLLLSCEVNDNSETYDTNVLRVAGKYGAVVFWEPGSLDGGVDILASGGFMSIELKTTKEITGKLIIPDSSNISFAPFNGSFNGKFNISEDTLRFQDTDTFLDNSQLFFHFNDSIITSTRIYDPRGIILDLKKQKGA